MFLSQKEVLECTVACQGSLLLSTSLVPTVEQQERIEASSLDLIRETRKILRVLEQQEKVYHPLTNFAASLFAAIQKLSATLGYFQFPLHRFQALLVDVIEQHKCLQTPDDGMALRARVLHLRHRLMEAVFSALHTQLFCQHQVLLPLTVSLEALMAEGKLLAEEYKLLTTDVWSVQEELEVLLADAKCSNGSSEGPATEKPEWVSAEVSIIIYIADHGVLF